MAGRFAEIIDRFVSWGQASERVFAALIVGSQAREDHPADEYSDLDITMAVDDPAHFLSSDEWLSQIGAFHVSFIERTIDGNKERRVLFDGALDVDFVILPWQALQALDPAKDAHAVLSRGYRVLIDKVGLAQRLPQALGKGRAHEPMTAEAFENSARDFWYHTVWAAKKLLRGELWMAKFCVDSYMKSRLFVMIELHARAKNGQDWDTWHDGRFVEEWAEDWILDKLAQCFAHYEREDIGRALLATMSLYRSVATEVAGAYGFAYPARADRYTSAWVRDALRP